MTGRIEVDMHDPEVLLPVSRILYHRGINCSVENTGGGCYCIVVEGESRWSSAVTPKDEDGRRWWVSLDDPDGEYLGMAETEIICADRLPTAMEAADAVEIFIRRFHPEFPNARAITQERLNNAMKEAADAFWAKVVEHFPEVEFGDYGPEETMDWEQAVERHIKLWLYWNHPLGQTTPGLVKT